MEPNSLAQQLAPEDYCAAHSASIAESVVSHLTRPMGRVVNYRDLPGAYYHDIFPRLLGYPVSHRQLTDMQRVATLFQESQQWPPSQTKCRAGWENLSSRFGAQGTAGQPCGTTSSASISRAIVLSTREHGCNAIPSTVILHKYIRAMFVWHAIELELSIVFNFIGIGFMKDILFNGSLNLSPKIDSCGSLVERNTRWYTLFYSRIITPSTGGRLYTRSLSFCGTRRRTNFSLRTN
jgi:hypothetical protein